MAMTNVNMASQMSAGATMAQAAALGTSLAIMPASSIAAVMGSPAWAAAGSEAEEMPDDNAAAENNNLQVAVVNDVHAGGTMVEGEELNEVPTFVKPYLSGEDTAMLTKNATVQESIVQALQAVGAMSADNAKGMLANTNMTNFAGVDGRLAKASSLDTNAVSSQALVGGDAVGGSDLFANNGPSENFPIYTRPMSPMTSAQNIYMIAADVEQQREHLHRAHQINAAEERTGYHKDWTLKPQNPMR